MNIRAALRRRRSAALRLETVTRVVSTKGRTNGTRFCLGGQDLGLERSGGRPFSFGRRPKAKTMRLRTRYGGAARWQMSWKLRLVVVAAISGGPSTINAQQPEPSAALIQRIQSALEGPQPCITGEGALSPLLGKPESC